MDCSFLSSVWCTFLSYTCTCVFQGIPVTLDKHTLGFDTGGEWLFSDLHKAVLLEPKINVFSDATLNEAAQILRLLHIEELRELQTKINEAIVAVQAIIADPKTDHRLGKVGRWEDEEGCLRKKGRDWKLNICHWTQDYFLFAAVWDQIVWVGRSWKNTTFWNFALSADVLHPFVEPSGQIFDLSENVLKFLHCGCVVKIQKH